MDLRLDSCADITLISEEHYLLMENRPPLRSGHRMSLAQLTDNGTAIKGYVKLKIFMLSVDGELIGTEAEAYVVKGMSVPILLGEDYQQNYELGVNRNVERGTKIEFRGTSHEVEATGVNVFVGRAEVHAMSAWLTAHADGMSKAKAHRRAKAKRRRRTLRNRVETKTIRAADDHLIKPHQVKVVRVTGDFSEDKDWMVERVLDATPKNRSSESAHDEPAG